MKQTLYGLTVTGLVIVSFLSYLMSNTMFRDDVITKVILVTHYRSGSTLLGDVIRQGDHVFYLFEPLFHPSNELSRSHHVVGGVFIQSENTSTHLRRLPDSYVTLVTKLFYDLLNCHLRSVPYQILISSVRSLPYLQPYRLCLSTNPAIPLDDVAADVRSVCLPLAERLCRRSRLRIIKTIRIPAEWLAILEKNEPNVKFIYMIRDPRGRLWSLIGKRTARSYNKTDALRKYVESEQPIWCKRLADDAVWIKKFTHLNPDRLLAIKYEDLAIRFTPTVQRIYSFVGRSTESLGTKWVRNRTAAEKDGGRMSTYRRNSTWTAVRWRHEMPSWMNDVVGNVCQPVLDSWNYL